MAADDIQSQIDELLEAGKTGSPVAFDHALRAGPRRSLADRFAINFEAGQRYNTLAGAAVDTQFPEERAQFDDEYAGFEAWDGFIEGLTALSGQLAGSALAVENFIPVGLGAKMLRGGQVGYNTLRARIFAGAVDAGVTNLAVDSAIQGMEVGSGYREGFSATDLAASTALGSVAGGAFGAVSRSPAGTPAKVEAVAGQLEKGAEALPAQRTPLDASVRQSVPEEGTTASPRQPLDVTLRPRPAPDRGVSIAASAKAEALPAEERIARGFRFFDEEAPVPDAPRSEDGTPKALGDQLFEEVGLAQPEVKAMAEPPAAKPEDVLTDGPFGPVIDAKAYAGNWQGLVARLSEMESGEARGALQHPEVGPIDLMWGYYDAEVDKGFGLKKLKDKHPEVVDDLPEIVAGSEVYYKDSGRVKLKNDKYRSIVNLQYDGRDKVWLITSYDNTLPRKKGKQRRADGDSTSHRSYQADTNSSSASPLESRLSQDPVADQGGSLRGDRGSDTTKARLTGALGQPSRPDQGRTTAQAVNKPQALARVSDLAQRLSDVTELTATRQGRFGPRAPGSGKPLGTYNLRSGVVRIRHQDDFDTFAHEVGHHIEERFKEDVLDLFQRHPLELERLAYPGVPDELKLTEGFAEFFRLYMTNRAFLKEKVTSLFNRFESLLTKKDKALKAEIDDIYLAYQDWIFAPSSQVVDATIVSSKKPGPFKKFSESIKRYGLGGTIAERLYTAYGSVLDDFNPIKRAVRELLRIHYANTGELFDLKVADDASKLVDLTRGAQQRGHMDLMYGVHGYRTLAPESRGMHDALAVAHGYGSNRFAKYDEDVVSNLNAYLWSRRAVFEWERYEAGEIPNPPDKLSKGDHLTNIAETEAASPQFIEAAEIVYEFVRALWKKKLDSGLINKETYEAGLRIRDYVPGLRAFDYDGDPVGSGGRGAKGAAPATLGDKRFKGSSRDVINPLETIMADVYETNAAIARNDVVKALAKLARVAGPGAGRVAELVPAHETRALVVDPLEALKSAGERAGLRPAEVEMMADSMEGVLGDAKATLFRPAQTNAKGEPIIFFREGGQIKALRLADGQFGQEMMGAFSMMSPQQSHLFTRLLAGSALALRQGVTTTPEFVLANVVRDLMTSFVYYDDPLRMAGNIGRGFWDEVSNSKMAQEYNALGGIMGGANSASVRDGLVKRDLKALRAKGWLARRVSSVKALLELAEVSETSVRVGLTRTFKNEAMKRGLSETEAALEAVWRARDHINFDRRGHLMTGVNRMVPFLNAALQGTDKFARHMVVPFVRKMRGDIVSAEDVRALNTASKAWARLAAVTVAGMGLHALMSTHAEYNELNDYTRSTHWMVKFGEEWFAVPKPFEMAAVINAAEAAWDAFAKQDPAAAERWIEGLMHVAVPPNIMESNPVVRSYFEVRANKDFFTDRELVPAHLRGLEPALQYTERTGKFAKQLGAAIGWPPAVVEQVILNVTGGWGRNLKALYEYTDETRLGNSLDDMPFVRRFAKDPAKGARSVSKFWDLVAPTGGRFEQVAQSYRAMVEGGDAAGAAAYLAELTENERAYVTASMLPASARRLHPMVRARSVMRAASALRKELRGPYITSAFARTDFKELSAADRGAANDILQELAMAEARNALIVLGVPGWAHQKPMDTASYHRELQGLSPVLFQALADRFATARVWPAKQVILGWPELKKRLLMDGSDAVTVDLEVVAEAGGPELAGFKIGRSEKPAVPGLRVRP